MTTLRGLVLAGVLLAAAPFAIAPSAVAQAPVTQLPVVVNDGDWTPLREAVDPSLQAKLESALSANRAWNRLIGREEMAVALVDISDPANPRFARVNGNSMIYAASLPKIAVLLAVEQAIGDGLVELTPQVETDLHAMIRRSSNTAATANIDRVGMAYIDSVLTLERYGLYDPEFGGGLWVGKRYAKSGPRLPDPIAGLSHGATVSQVSRYYYLLATGRLVSPERSHHMLEVLVAPGINHKFVYAVSQRAPRARIFRKSGTWRDWHADSVLVWGPDWRRYILVSLVQSSDGERILRDLVPLVEGILHPDGGTQ
jgi:beta-lactamase class A